MTWPRTRRPGAVEMAPLAGVCAGLALAAGPLVDRIAAWVTALLAVAIVVRLVLNHRSQRLPSLPTKLLLLAAGAMGVAATFGSVVGVEAGLSMMLLLVSLKLLETNSVRDFQVLTLLGFFLALCDLFFSQDLLMWLYVALVLVVLTGGLVRFHRRAGACSYARAVRLAFTLLLQALPIAALLFLFLPRSSVAPPFRLAPSPLASQGISDRLAPGSVASLAANDAIAFRAQFPDGTRPDTADMYWRGPVLWRGDGLQWGQGNRLSEEAGARRLAGSAMRQSISLLPSGGQFLFALDRPESAPPSAAFQAGGWLQNARPIVNTLHYEVTSRPENRQTALPPDHLQAALALPPRLSPEAWALAASWRNGAPTGRAIVANGLRYFHNQPFTYTLTPGAYGENALDEFLFRRRAGFCEHYAAAFATLMRAAKMPARIVVGYRGGEYNALGDYVIVRQADAHAWCEVWIAGSGWLRVDPTEAIAPERVSAGLAPRLQAGAPHSTAARGVRMRGNLARQAGLAWDSINYHWDLLVLDFDEDRQRALFGWMGVGHFARAAIVTWSVLAMAVLLALVALWLRRPARFRGDAVSRGYERFCRRLAAAGVAREVWEGPLGFTERAARSFPDQSAALRRIGALYVGLRYARTPPPVAEFARALRAMPALSRAPVSAAEGV